MSDTRKKINAVSDKRIVAAIEVMKDVIELKNRLSPLSVSEALYNAIYYLEGYRAFANKSK